LIVIEPRSVSPDRPNVYEVRHRGYSAALQSHVDTNSKQNKSNCLAHPGLGLEGATPAFNISRSGSATMGFPSTKYVDDYYAERIVRPQLANPYAAVAQDNVRAQNK
jgi:hypothetical protein